MSEVNFDKATHTYSLEGKKLISVTQLLQMFHLSPDYTIVDEDTLRFFLDKVLLFNFGVTFDVEYTLHEAD